MNCEQFCLFNIGCLINYFSTFCTLQVQNNSFYLKYGVQYIYSVKIVSKCGYCHLEY